MKNTQNASDLLLNCIGLVLDGRLNSRLCILVSLLIYSYDLRNTRESEYLK